MGKLDKRIVYYPNKVPKCKKNPSFIVFPSHPSNLIGVRILVVRHVHGEPGGPPREFQPWLGAQGREGQGRGGRHEVIGKTLFGK